VELDDVFKLRYDVYVTEQSKFSEKRATSDGRIVDHFDTLPGVANIVAYDGDVAVASFRVNRDSSIGLAPEKYFDFAHVRKDISVSGEKGQYPSCIVSGSMLAIREKWRHQRKVILALFRKTTAVMQGWGATHVFGAASADTFSLYGRLGFHSVAEEQWVESIGDSLVPMMAPFDKVSTWAFGQINPTVRHFWLDNYSGQFETILLSPGEVLFQESDEAKHAYSVYKGSVTISRDGPDGTDFQIAHLSQGTLFGELAMFDGEPRLATATATMNTEVIAIEYDHLLEVIHRDSDKMNQLLLHFTDRLRQIDQLAMVQSFAPQTSRVAFELHELWNTARPEKEHSATRIVQIDAGQIARRARVRESEVRRVLETGRAAGRLDYGDNVLRFFKEPDNDDNIHTERHSNDRGQ